MEVKPHIFSHPLFFRLPFLGGASEYVTSSLRITNEL